MTRRRSTALSLLFASAGCSAPDLDDPAEPLPASGFEFYSGDETTAGDLFVGVTEWSEPKTQNVVTLVPMIHMADADFYDEVARIARGADVTLMEGLGGAPSLSPTTFFLTYLFESYPRARFFGGLVAQSEGLGALPNGKYADATWAEFSAATPWWTPLLHAVALPLAVVILEPLEFGRYGEALIRSAGGGRVRDEAAFRHFLVHSPDDEEDSFLLPGVVTARNRVLLASLRRTLEGAHGLHVVVPWGADHCPGIADALEQSGFERTSHRWLRAVAVRSYLDGSAPDPAGEQHRFYLPYVVDWTGYRDSWSFGCAFDVLSCGVPAPGTSVVELLWGYLFASRIDSTRAESEVAIGPQLFGRPLLCDWRRADGQWRLRFLGFFSIGS